VLPPARRVRLPSELEEPGDLLWVGDAIQAQQVDDVAVFEADLAVLQPVDLPFRGPDRLGGFLAGEAHVGPEPAQLGAD
jgi:hypothetical protein